MREQREQLWHLSRVAMLGELSGALAHELSQPMTAILANAQVARRRLPEGPVVEVREIIEDIESESKRAADVIRQLRAMFARGERAAVSLDINECVRTVFTLGHSDLVARNITTELQLARVLPAVRADRVQLQQVLLNLLINAAQAIGERVAGGAEKGAIRVSTRCAGEHVIIVVEDDGVGIPSAIRSRIFDPFFTTKEEGHGTGLGLAICRRVVDEHQGDIRIESEVGKGTSIVIVLPVNRSVNADRVRENPSGGASAPK